MYRDYVSPVIGKSRMIAVDAPIGKIMKRMKDLGRGDQTRAWALLESLSGHYLGPAVWLQTLAALRVSEVQALTWGSVLFDLDQILISAAFNNKVGAMQDYPKQEDWAYVPMAPKLKEYLLPLSRGRHPGAFVTPGVKGGMLPYETYHRALKRPLWESGRAGDGYARAQAFLHGDLGPGRCLAGGHPAAPESRERHRDQDVHSPDE